MLRLQIYILGRLAGSLLLVLLVVSTILFVGQTVQFLDRMPDVGLEFVLAVMPMFLPVTLSLTLPLAFLVAAILVYGRLADDNEVLAARMAGIHPWALVAPGVFAGAVLSFFCLDLQQNRAPAAIAAQDGLKGDLHRRFVEIIEHGARNSFTTRELKISWAGVEGGALTDLHISEGGLDDPDHQEVHASRGSLQRDASGRNLLFTLEDYTAVRGRGEELVTSRGDRWTYAVSTAELLKERMELPKPRALGYRALLFRSFLLPEGSKGEVEVSKELFGRVSIALAPLVFALAGIPLALLVGRGSRAAAAVLAFGVAVVFFLVWQTGNSLASRGSVPIAPAMLASDAVVLVAGLVLLRRVVRR